MNEDAVLLVVAIKKDADGFPTETEKEIPVYVREKSVTRSEFYAALREGIAVKTVFEIRIEDFEQSAHMVGEKKNMLPESDMMEVFTILSGHIEPERRSWN